MDRIRLDLGILRKPRKMRLVSHFRGVWDIIFDQISQRLRIQIPNKITLLLLRKGRHTISKSRTIMPGKGGSTRLNPVRLQTVPHLRIRRPNEQTRNPCVVIMSSMLSTLFCVSVYLSVYWFWSIG